MTAVTDGVAMWALTLDSVKWALVMQFIYVAARLIKYAAKRVFQNVQITPLKTHTLTLTYFRVCTQP